MNALKGLQTFKAMPHQTESPSLFTTGIGENSPEVRGTVCAGLGFLGLKLDPHKNARPLADQDIAASDSTVRVLVVRAQEDWVIARECWKLAKNATSEDFPSRTQGKAATGSRGTEV